MVSRQIPRLPGMRDLAAPARERISEAIGIISTGLSERGYSTVDTPLLEETELFIRKSGGELTSRLYSFTDPGGHNVSLRPEFTSSVIRYFVHEQESLPVPVRWQYSGPVFRYERGDAGGYRQFTQAGAELVGAAGVEADAEIIGLAWAGLDQVGIRGHLVRVGHLGALGGALDSFSLSEPARLFAISNVGALKSGRVDVADLRRQAERVGLIKAKGDGSGDTSRTDAGPDASQGFIESVLRESMPTPVGRRTTEQIVARLLRKVRDADDPAALEDALVLIGRLARLDGAPGDVLDGARRIGAEGGARSDAFDELETLVELLARGGIPRPQVTLDLGLARGLSYYTGVIFETVHSARTRMVSLGGGGRYDALVRAFGGDGDVPALGFAYNMDQVVDALDEADS